MFYEAVDEQGEMKEHSKEDEPQTRSPVGNARQKRCLRSAAAAFIHSSDLHRKTY